MNTKRLRQHMFSSKKLAAAGIVAAAALALTACSDDTAPVENADGPLLVTAGTLTVCSNAPFEPFEYNDADGNLTGIDIDLTKLAAEKLGLEYVAMQYDFDAMSSGAAFESNSCDVLATGMTITPERQAKFDFSDPYYDANQGALVKTGSTATSLKDLEGKNVGAQVETTGLTIAKDAGFDVQVFPEVGSLVQAVATGQIDAAIADIGVLESYTTDELSIAFTEKTDEQYGFGVKKDNPKLVEALNAAIKDAKADGTYDEIITKHVGAAGN
ncbi:ABC transporter substrate-binding protein [Timonella senegalensis]|uniref:ABC transporter substrate-binding protein n=1 Tax=Timonella senegalensis TaxID=1465825 RepID=UPI002FDCA176